MENEGRSDWRNVQTAPSSDYRGKREEICDWDGTDRLEEIISDKAILVRESLTSSDKCVLETIKRSSKRPTVVHSMVLSRQIIYSRMRTQLRTHIQGRHQINEWIMLKLC